MSSSRARRGWQTDRCLRRILTLFDMHRISVYLTSKEVARLARLSDLEGISVSEVIRRAIRQYTPPPRLDRRLALIGVADGPGGSIADVAAADLLEGLGS